MLSFFLMVHRGTRGVENGRDGVINNFDNGPRGWRILKLSKGLEGFLYRSRVVIYSQFQIRALRWFPIPHYKGNKKISKNKITYVNMGI